MLILRLTWKFRRRIPMLQILSILFVLLFNGFSKEGVEAVNARKMRVILDPGHGGKDSVTRVNGVREKDLVLDVAKEVRQVLERSGFEVVMTREEDYFVSLVDRAAFDGDVFISIHANAVADSIGPSVRSMIKGMEIYTANVSGQSSQIRTRSEHLGRMFEKKMRELKEIDMRGVKRKSLAVLNENPSPAVMIELGFLTNQEDLEFLTNKANQKKVANAFAAALEDYRRIYLTK